MSKDKLTTDPAATETAETQIATLTRELAEARQERDEAKQLSAYRRDKIIWLKDRLGQVMRDAQSARRERDEAVAVAEVMREALGDINMQATRKNRATDNKIYLVNDLDIIIGKCYKALALPPSVALEQVKRSAVREALVEILDISEAEGAPESEVDRRANAFKRAWYIYDTLNVASDVFHENTSLDSEVTP